MRNPQNQCNISNKRGAPNLLDGSPFVMKAGVIRVTLLSFGCSLLLRGDQRFDQFRIDPGSCTAVENAETIVPGIAVIPVEGNQFV